MSARPCFSVVIDNHNYGRFLRQTIDSVLAQDLPPSEYEVVVVDDGSTDDSRAILASYGDRIRPVLQERQGQAAAFNRGFAESRGEVFCLLDSDDVWRPQKLSSVARLFQDPAVGVVQHWLEETDGALRPLPQKFPAWPGRYRVDDFLAGRTEFTATSGLCLRRKFLEKVLPIPRELFYYLDDFLFAGVLFQAEAVNVSKVLGSHRVHGGNWCSGAGVLGDARKLAVDLRMREIVSRQYAAWAEAAGRAIDPQGKAIEELETWRREVLRAAWCARPVEAWGRWREGFARFSGSGFGRFRLATVLLAVASPTLYLQAYRLYARLGRLRELRHHLYPAG